MSAAGFTAWFPLSMYIVHRRRSGRSPVLRQKPSITGTVFVFNDPLRRDDLMGLRYVEGIWRDASNCTIYIPDDQVQAFRTELDAVNDAVLARLKKATTKPIKQRWKKLDPVNLKSIFEDLFGEKREVA